RPPGCGSFRSWRPARSGATPRAAATLQLAALEVDLLHVRADARRRTVPFHLRADTRRLSVLNSLRTRNEWKFLGVLRSADLFLATLWWLILLARGVLPALFGIAMGFLVGAVQRGQDLAGPLALVGVVFVMLQVLVPIHQAVGLNLGDRT